MIKAVVFDLDGTLLNTIEDLAGSTNHALRLASLPEHSVEDYYSFVGNGIEKLLERASGCLPGSETFDLVKKEFMEHYSRHSMDKTHPYDGMNDLLNKLNKKGIALAVLSNKNDSFIKTLMEKFYPEISFDVLMGKRDEYPPKPDPASLKEVLRQLKAKEGEVLYVGDSNVDVQTAHGANLPCIGVTWGFRTREELIKEGAERLADKPEDILNRIEALEK